jgi:hypothetical protein
MPGFKAGIEAGADAVMTTAVYVPGLGGGNTPAMFSAPVVNRSRTQLGFEGDIAGTIRTDGATVAAKLLLDAVSQERPPASA